MNHIKTDEEFRSEEATEQLRDDGLKLVPVAESIRYRKRAQSAERKAETLAEELAQAKSEAAEAAEKLGEIELEQRLMRKLAAVGAVDLEAALLVTKARIESDKKADLDGVIDNLRKEKGHLFGGSGKDVATTRKTAVVKDGMHSGRTVLEGAAKKAATTGSRADLQEYLRLRRNFA
ncbi:MAG: hypothetical protein JXB29_04250 [Sedimentisphaerales bacterium]|nr:hypothetical protein [Sedimentisphaerales bacterium]